MLTRLDLLETPKKSRARELYFSSVKNSENLNRAQQITFCLCLLSRDQLFKTVYSQSTVWQFLTLTELGKRKRAAPYRLSTHAQLVYRVSVGSDTPCPARLASAAHNVPCTKMAKPAPPSLLGHWAVSFLKVLFKKTVSDSCWSNGGKLFHAASAAYKNVYCPNFSRVRGCL